jgi:site-specific DNA-methyltransferase (adenine-specific)
VSFPAGGRQGALPCLPIFHWVTTVKTYDATGAMLFVCDCIEAPIRGTSPVDLLFADPPFNIGQDYGDEFADRASVDEYRAGLVDRIRATYETVREGGAIFWHVPDSVVALVDIVLSELGGIRENWIVLYQEFGQYGESKFIGSKVHILYYTKPPRKLRTWNVKEVLEPSRRLLSGDKRVHTAKHGGMRPFTDVWFGEKMGRVQGNNAERRAGHPNQVAEMVIARIIRCASNPGDLVFDPYTGSGTTGAVARTLGREFIGCEISPKLAASAWERIQSGAVRDVAGELYAPPVNP